MRRPLTLVFVLMTTALPLFGQGLSDRPTFEEIQVKPITVAKVDGFDFLLVCNTPDDSLEIYSTRDHSLLHRLPTGQGPVSVVYHPGLERVYTTNQLGDSITVARLAASGHNSIKVTLEQTTWVRDEPWHLAFYTLPATETEPARETLLVTHMTPDTVGWRDALTLEPLAPGLGAVHNETGLDLDGDGQDDVDVGLKEPRTVAVLGDQLVTLATKGGNGVYDNDVWCGDLVTGATRQHGGLGSFNANMTVDSGGNVYVVGGLARNDLPGEPAVASALTGFLKSMFYFVEDICTDNIQIAERDLNAVPGLQAVNPVTGLPEAAPVPQNESLAMPMDVALFEQDGVVTKIFIAAFSIDRIGVLKPNFSQAVSQWPLDHIDTESPLAGGNAMGGPRGLAVKYADPEDAESRDRVYVLKRLDNSVTVLDPHGETVVASFPLANDPRPRYVRAGQEFLFGAQHSGNHFVSCASCHVDARTDRLVWNLGNDDGPVPIPPTLKDNTVGDEWPSQKGNMVTQTLQGLLNFEVDEKAQRLFTNAPYHWRGDRNDFDDFNPAFVSLLKRDTELEPAEMAAYKRYVFSIHYPGNPKQLLNHTYSSEFGAVADADDTTVGTDAQHGMKLFFMVNSDGRSCVHCHALPEGSNNLLTEGVNNPIEVAALRHIFQREGRLDKGRATLPSNSPFSGITGLTHNGGIGVSSPFDAAPFNEIDVNPVITIDAFDRVFFSGAFCANYGDFCPDLQDVNRFVHEFDTGVSGLVGFPITVHPGTAPALTQVVLDLFESQAAVANVGIAAHYFSAGGVSGYAFNTISGKYVPMAGGPAVDRPTLLALLSGAEERLVVQATPLGSERRIASTTGVAPPLPAVQPSAIDMLPWRPSTPYVNVPLMTGFWDNSFDTTSFYPHMVRLLQYGLLQDGAPLGALGLTQLRHEAPRRVVVRGRQIQPGAEVHIFVPDDPSGPPNLALRPEQAGQIATIQVELPLYRTGEIVEGLPVWQTAVEWAPLVLYKTMLGGDFAPGIQTTLNDTAFAVPEPPNPGMFDPVNWGFVYVRVVNPSGLAADAGWRRVELSPPPT